MLATKVLHTGVHRNVSITTTFPSAGKLNAASSRHTGARSTALMCTVWQEGVTEGGDTGRPGPTCQLDCTHLKKAAFG